MAKFYLSEPRRIETLNAECHADPVLFLDWDDMPKRAKNEFTKNGPIPCEGGGVPGEWCVDCRFGKLLRDCE